MSNPHLPAELVDNIVDLLYDSRTTLKSCCLVSKSWIPRARKHLFTDVEFSDTKDLESWKTAFSDPSTSPARYTRVLLVKYPLTVTAADGEEGGWISTFTNVVEFKLNAVRTVDNWSAIHLFPFCGFAPALKSLHLSFYAAPSSQVFNLIHSFPLLKDLSVFSVGSWIGTAHYLDERPIAARSLIQSALTGSLELNLWLGSDFLVPQLLSLPGGIRFQKICFTLNQEKDISPMMALVEGCCSTLESLEVVCELSDLPLGSTDLSKATQLKDTLFVCKYNPKWIIVMLQSVTRNRGNLQRVSIAVPQVLYRPGFRDLEPINMLTAVGRTAFWQWLELDKLLAQLQESHSIRPEVLFNVPPSMDREQAMNFTHSMLPRLTMRGLVGLRWPGA